MEKRLIISVVLGFIFSLNAEVNKGKFSIAGIKIESPSQNEIVLEEESYLIDENDLFRCVYKMHNKDEKGNVNFSLNVTTESQEQGVNYCETLIPEDFAILIDNKNSDFSYRNENAVLNVMHPKSWTKLRRCILMAKKGQTFKKYSAEFKLCVILDMREHGLNYCETVRKYWQTKSRAEEDNHRSQVKDWERIYLTEGAEGLMVERRGRGAKGRPRKKPSPPEAGQDILDEVQRLRERNEYLEAELEYLKKLDALVRAEEKRNGKKR